MHGSEEYFSNPIEDNLSLLMIQRGAGGAVIINAGGETILNGVDANLLADGRYIDFISGNVFIVSNGILSGRVNAESVVVFY